MAFQRIVVDHQVMAGVPCIRGTRIPVATLIGMVAEGMTTGEILVDFPQLTADDVREALQFAAAAVDQATFPLAASAALHNGWQPDPDELAEGRAAVLASAQPG
jgi:uncharacterized protein (DUF433 family)